MLESTRLQKERAATQNKLNSDRFVEIRSTDADYETLMGEHKALREQLNGINDQIIEALDKEDLEAQAAMANRTNTDGWSPELRAFRDLAQKTSIKDYVQAVITERNVQGAAAEYNQHIFDQWHPGDYPLEMLLDRNEFFDFDAAMLQSVQTANLDDEKRTAHNRRRGDGRKPVLRGPAACKLGSGLPARAVPSSRGGPPKLAHRQRQHRCHCHRWRHGRNPEWRPHHRQRRSGAGTALLRIQGRR